MPQQRGSEKHEALAHGTWSRRARPPLAEGLAIGRQIAGALAAAHDAGIIHRDLKPANVKVDPDGVGKLLDFGLWCCSAAVTFDDGSYQ